MCQKLSFEFCHNFSFWVLSQFEFWITVCSVFEFYSNISCRILRFWVMTQFEHLIFVNSWFFFKVLSQFEFLVLSIFLFFNYKFILSQFDFCSFLITCLATIWVLEFSHTLVFEFCLIIFFLPPNFCVWKFLFCDNRCRVKTIKKIFCCCWKNDIKKFSWFI